MCQILALKIIQSVPSPGSAIVCLSILGVRLMLKMTESYKVDFLLFPQKPKFRLGSALRGQERLKNWIYCWILQDWDKN